MSYFRCSMTTARCWDEVCLQTYAAVSIWAASVCGSEKEKNWTSTTASSTGVTTCRTARFACTRLKTRKSCTRASSVARPGTSAHCNPKTFVPSENPIWKHLTRGFEMVKWHLKTSANICKHLLTSDDISAAIWKHLPTSESIWRHVANLFPPPKTFCTTSENICFNTANVYRC